MSSWPYFRARVSVAHSLYAHPLSHVSAYAYQNSSAFLFCFYDARAVPARAGRALTVEDLSIAIEAAADLGRFLVQEALSWDWGSWPEGSPQSTDPDLGKSGIPLLTVYTVAACFRVWFITAV